MPLVTNGAFPHLKKAQFGIKGTADDTIGINGMEDRIIAYGGQAVLEGVLMRGQKALAIAMRAPDGKIVVHTEKISGIYQSVIARIPFARGVILLWDALGLGMKALTISANVQTGEEEKLEGPMLYGTLAVSLTFGIGLFFLVPYGVGKFGQWLGLDVWSGAALEGIFRLLLIIGYMWAVGQMPDIRRVFQYHGAEHKTINAFEAGAELTPESVARFPLEHPRCGTSFLLTLAVLSIVAFSFLHPLSVFFQIVRWLIQPNLALQKLTTREPELSMLEVSIRSFNEMMALEKA